MTSAAGITPSNGPTIGLLESTGSGIPPLWSFSVGNERVGVGKGVRVGFSVGGGSTSGRLEGTGVGDTDGKVILRLVE